MKKLSLTLFLALCLSLAFAQERLTPEILWQMERVYGVEDKVPGIKSGIVFSF
jgi:hypothetical protein